MLLKLLKGNGVGGNYIFKSWDENIFKSKFVCYTLAYNHRIINSYMEILWGRMIYYNFNKELKMLKELSATHLLCIIIINVF